MKKKANSITKHIQKIRKIMGAGYIVVPTYILIAAIFAFLDHWNFIPHIGFGKLEYFFKSIFVLIFIVGFCIWLYVVLRSRLVKSILEDRLVTDGIFSIVRNPMYFGVAMIVYGSVCYFTMNVFTLFVFPLQWIVTTWIVKRTEEPWLYKKFGAEYVEYCAKVNRFIPSFRK